MPRRAGSVRRLPAIARGARRPGVVPSHDPAEVRGMNALQSTKDGIRASLRDLLSLHGAPGFEQSPVAYFQKRVSAIADTVEVDRYGNVSAVKRGRHDHPRLMISAHLDEIGFIVK